MLGNGLIFEKNLFIGQKALGASTLRSQVILNNIANVDTPAYKRKTVSFESELNRALNSEKQTFYPTKMTDERHIPFFRQQDYREVNSRLDTEFDSNYKNDKNNVDIEKESADEVKNSLYYNAVTQIMNRSIQRFKSVLV